MFAARVQTDRRQSERDEVFYRTRVNVPGGGSFPAQVVNISANGFMARTETDLAVGQTVTIRLPVIGEVKADVRWSLGGRVGCQFAHMLELAAYLELLAALARDGR